MQDFQKIGTAYLGLLRSNPWVHAIQYTPGFQVVDYMMCASYDYWFSMGLKMYYWPAFVAGSADNIADLFKPQTYSICKA